MRRILLASADTDRDRRSHLRIGSTCDTLSDDPEKRHSADLYAIRIAIIDYTLREEQLAITARLDERALFEEIPTDPFTRKEDWVPIIATHADPEQTAAGIASVHSASARSAAMGLAYNTW